MNDDRQDKQPLTTDGSQETPKMRQSDTSPLWEALLAHRRAFLGIFLFSVAVSLLMLTGPFFMLQVYDRVLPGQSTSTLVAFIALIAFAFYVMGVTDHYRGRVMARIGAAFQESLEKLVLQAVFRQAEYPQLRDESAGALRDLVAIRAALASPGMVALFDLPGMLIFIITLFGFHSWLGWFALVSGAMLVLLTYLNQRLTRKQQAKAARLEAQADARTVSICRAIETVKALGMTSAMITKWQDARDEALEATMASSDAGGPLSAAIKALRQFLQSAILGLGAYLAIGGELTPGSMIAGSILLGRALAPVEQVMSHWSQLQRAIASWRRLERLLKSFKVESEKTRLPRPAAQLEVRELTVKPPGASKPVLEGITFSAAPGDAIAVVGASASGKSSLARALVGRWRPAKGEIRLGKASLHHYDSDRLGSLLGYLPQTIELFQGTVAENIARLDTSADPESVIEAAQLAGAHETILELQNAYDTRITDGGECLSGGQRQRIALARALYGDPVAFILDEPNAFLDDNGVQALNQAIGNARAKGKVVIIMSHRPSALAQCNKVMILNRGKMLAFGPRDEILKRHVSPAAQPQ